MNVSYGLTFMAATRALVCLEPSSAAALARLERRSYSQIANAIKGVIGRDVGLQFVPAT